MNLSEQTNPKKLSLLTEDHVTISVTHSLWGHPNVCILAHGFLGNRQRPYIKDLAKRLAGDWDIITFDFRGHGDSRGICTGRKEFYDIKAVVDYARNRGYHKIILVGFSSGGIEGIYYAAKFHDIDALITVSTPANAEVVKSNARWLFWLLSNRLGRMVLRPVVKLDNLPEFPKPVAVVEQVSPIPLLIVQGGQDLLVDVEQAEMLYQKAKEPKELRIIEGMRHPPGLPEQFFETVEQWLSNISR